MRIRVLAIILAVQCLSYPFQGQAASFAAAPNPVKAAPVKAKDPRLDMGGLKFSSVAGQGKARWGALDHRLRLYGNSWVSAPLARALKRNTVLEFDIVAAGAAEAYAIGVLEKGKTMPKIFQIDGSETYGMQYLVSLGVTAKHIAIPIGSYFTGDISAIYFVADDDGKSAADVTFSNVVFSEK